MHSLCQQGQYAIASVFEAGYVYNRTTQDFPWTGRRNAFDLTDEKDAKRFFARLRSFAKPKPTVG